MALQAGMPLNLLEYQGIQVFMGVECAYSVSHCCFTGFVLIGFEEGKYV